MSNKEGICHGLEEILQNSKHSDFEIRCHGHAFKVHKVMLAIHSPVLERAATGGFKEAQQNFIDLPDDDPTYVQAMVKSMYASDYDDSHDITDETTINPLVFNTALWILAEKYDMKLVQKTAINRAKSSLIAMESQPDNQGTNMTDKGCTWDIETLVIGLQYIYDFIPSSCDDNPLKEMVADFVADNYSPLSRFDPFLHLLDPKTGIQELHYDVSKRALEFVKQFGAITNLRCFTYNCNARLKINGGDSVIRNWQPVCFRCGVKMVSS